MNSLPFFGCIVPETSSYLATLSLQRPSAPSTSIFFSTVDSRPQGEYYWNGNAMEEPKELELVANILAGMKSKKVALGDEKVRTLCGQKRAIGSDSDNDSNGIDETFSDSDEWSMRQTQEFLGERKRFTDGGSPKIMALKEKSSDGEEKLGSPVSMFDAEEIFALDGDEQEQIQDSSDESSFDQSYSDFVKTFQEIRSRAQDDLTASPKPKRRFHGTPFTTIACEFHTQLHARCPPNCPERRPARPHPRSKKSKVEEFVEPKKQDTPRSSDSEIPIILDEDEDYEESDSKSSRLSSSSKKSRSKKNTPSRSIGRTGRKYLPQACDRHKLLHAKCPANCPDRIARDQKMLTEQQDMVEDSDC
jgi:hypothetical protein